MIDWLTLKLPVEYLLPGDQRRLESLQGVLMKTTAGGEVEWRAPTREEIRSDSHRLSWFLNAYELELYGSPARLGQGNNVFGERDARQCGLRMIRYFAATTSIALPEDLSVWRCTRADVTLNYALPTPPDVREALRCLSRVQGGHYRVSSNAETVYWNKSSALRAGKAYHKGPHLGFQIRKRQATASPEEVGLAERLLRFELALRAQFWRERSAKAWYEWSVEELEEEHRKYFASMIGTVEVVEVNGLLQRLQECARTPGQGSCAYNTWLAIRAEGLENVRSRMSVSSWQRHKKLLFEAGLSWADLQASNIVPFRRRTIELGAPVHSWDELRRAA